MKAAILLLTLMLTACLPAGPQTTPTAVPTPIVPEKPIYTVQRGTVLRVAEFQARVSPVLREDLFFSTDGIVRHVAVTRGQHVAAGQVLAWLEEPMRFQAETAAASLRAAQARQAMDGLVRLAPLRAAEARLALLEAEEAAAEALAQLERAQRDLRSLAAPDLGWHQQQVAEREHALLTAQQNAEMTSLGGAAQALRHAQEDLQLKTNQLNDVQAALQECPGCNTVYAAATGRFIAPADALRQYEAAVDALRVAEIQYEQASGSSQRAVERAQSDLEAAMANLSAAQHAPHAARLAQRQAAVAAAGAQVAVAEARRDEARYRWEILQLGPDPYELELAEAALADAEIRLAMAQASLAANELRAPFAGEVIAVNISAGSPATAFRVAISIADASELELTFVPGAEELAYISVGQPALVRLGGQARAGVVGQLPLDAGGRLNMADPTVRVTLDYSHDLVMGQAAAVVIELERREGVLWLPPAAVRSFQGQDFVMVQDGDLQRRVDVLLGLRTPERVEVIQGVSEGQRVLAP
jgi:HlyD family secretion protein